MWKKVFAEQQVDFFYSNSPLEAMRFRDRYASLTEVERLIEDKIHSNHVMVFSKSYCPYCKATKELLAAKGVPFGLLELDREANGTAI